MKRVKIITLVMMLILLASCSGNNAARQSSAPEKETVNAEESTDMIPVTMLINDEKVDVTWENNESAEALAELVSDSPLTIDMSMYGGFEQVGALGTDLPSSDINITTKPGDIMLYTGSNIVVFYGSNSWAYTSLGHIENKSADELKEILGSDNVKITLSAE